MMNGTNKEPHYNNCTMANSKLKIIQHNVLNWKTRKYELYNMYRAADPDIILINSHGNKQTETIKLFNYAVYQNNPTDNINDGVAIAIKRSIPHKIIDTLDEAFMAILVDTTLGPICVATGYQPPRRPGISPTNINRIFRRNHPTYFIGDLNATHTNLGHNRNNIAGRIINDFITQGLINKRGPEFKTTIGPQGSGNPDIILQNNACYHHTTCTPGPITTSDHIPIIYEISSSPQLIPAAPRLQINKANWDKFKESLAEKPVICINNQPSANVDTALNNWFEQITRAMDDNIPTIKHKTTSQYIITPEIQEIQTRYLHLLNKNKINNEWNERDRRLFRALQLNLQNKMIKLKDESWNKKILEIDIEHKDPATFWRKVKSLTGTNNTPTTYLKDDQGREYHTDSEKEQLFQDYYKDIYRINAQDNMNYCRQTETEVTNYLATHQDEYQPYETIDTERLIRNHSLIAPIEYYEVLQTIKALKAKKAPGHSKINKVIALNIPENMLQNLTHIFNASLSCGIFPQKFKKAILKLIPKPDTSPKNVKNFRPISLLELVGKVYEKIINKRLRKYAEENNIFHDNQYSYREKRGTTTALATLYETVAKQQEQKQQTAIITRDVSKAFDKVWHEGLMYKITQLRLPRCFAALLCNFLENRTARIKINNHTGNEFPLHCGVAQGSVLSPTLYNIYTADTPKGLHASNFLYADDVSQVVGFPGASKRMMARRIEREIERVNQYEKQWKIKTNKEKFKILYVSKKNPPEITVENQRINYSNEIKILGLKLGSHGFSKHITEKLRKARLAFNNIRRFNTTSPKVKLHLMKALVMPHLTYPPTPLFAASKTNIGKMQGLINRIIRWINGDRFPYSETAEQLHHKYKLTPINIKLYEMNAKVWDNIGALDPEQYQILRDGRESKHSWWPSSIIDINTPIPEPVYARIRRQNAQESEEESDSE